MKIDTFQIINCFGFRDSGVINLLDSHNFIYILGRNSSGKSSLLNAIKYFERRVTPAEMPNFQNFNDSGKTPWLIGEFSIGDGDFDVNTLIKAHLRVLASLGIDQSALQQNSLLKKMVNGVNELYEQLIVDLEASQRVRVHKDKSGHYHITHDINRDAYESRKTEVEKLISEADVGAGHFNIRGTNTRLNLTFNTFEDQLFQQFPNIYLFNEKYSLQQALPDRITTTGQNSGAFEKSFVEYLGAESVTSFLGSNDPDDREELLHALNLKVQALTEKVNQHRSQPRNRDLLEITLHENNGIQITIKTDGKKSYYSHLSEPTKFLFAYYLYAETNKITGDILLFDEPSNGFHPTAQEFILSFLQGLAKAGNLVVVATHSEHLIDLDLLSAVRLMGTDQRKSITVRNHFYDSAGGPGDYLALQPILDAIGFRYGRQINVKDKVNLVEGVTDLLYLRCFNWILNYPNEVDIAPGRGDGTLLNIIPLLISQGIRFKVVLDKGKVRGSIQAAFGIDDKFVYEVPIPSAFVGKMEGAGIEDLFTKGDFERILTKQGYIPTADFAHVSNSHYMKTSGHKRLVSQQFYENASSFTEGDFEPETIKNFRSLLDFCKNADWFVL